MSTELAAWRRRRWRRVLNGTAVLAALVALAWMSATWHADRDVTRARRHTLSTASIAVLETVPAPIALTAYLPPAHPWHGQLTHLAERYRRHRNDISLRIVDPGAEPAEMRDKDLKAGDLVVAAANREERVEAYTEQALTDALARLARADERFVVVVSGHGERSVRRGANHDLSDWARVLTNRGLNVQELNLAASLSVPDNTSVLVIASPSLDYQPPEIAALNDYIDRGGNLLWLMEPEYPRSLSVIAERLGVDAVPGTVVDPITLAHGIDNPAFLVLSRYGDHPALADFSFTTLLIYATALHTRPIDGWQAARMLPSGDKAWSETAPLEGNVTYEDGIDYPGPLPLAVALARTRDAGEQRVVVIGDGDFLSNTYLQNSGNQDLGVRLLDWLARDDQLIAVGSRTAEDDVLVLAPWQQAVIGGVFLVGLPGALLLNGLFVWWRRRRA